ncbi:MAG: potassium-transporting ATPase subunit KdpC [Verrucomicrobiota bacterium]|nr:potassium-transporting ATPase subunit KdpC [Verrucomicrobiota bacterium]
MKVILQSLRIYLVLTLLTGIIYPLALTGMAQLFFSRQANGSRITEQDKLIGSDLLAQKFEDAKYFWPRPSAADYATVASGASNKGPTAADLKKSIEERREKFGANAPIDLLTASGSGLDPHISPEAARSQIPRVSNARDVPTEKISALVDELTEAPQFGFLGDPRVNVLRLNLALDRPH